MINFLLKEILKFFDYFHKKKIINKLKRLNTSGSLETIFDIGAHEGESIELFLKNFKVTYIYSFEPSEVTFNTLSKNSSSLKKRFINSNIILENFAVGSENKNVELNYLYETSSSTIKKLNIDSSYFKKKEQYLGKLINKKMTVKQIDLKQYLDKKKINKINLLKIDTEGYELEVLKGLKDSIKNISIIIFEHHYDNMIVKNYTFSDIHDLLKTNGFSRAFKIKMPFRKSFDYIYIKE